MLPTTVGMLNVFAKFTSHGDDGVNAFPRIEHVLSILVLAALWIV